MTEGNMITDAAPLRDAKPKVLAHSVNSPLLATPPGQPIALVLNFRLRLSGHRQWFETWLDVLRRARRMPGCRRIALEQDQHEADCWSVVSEWESRETLAVFWRSCGLTWLTHGFDHVAQLKKVSIGPIHRRATRST